MPCVHCGLNKSDHEYNRDGGAGSGQPKKGTKPKRNCSHYLSKQDVNFTLQTKCPGGKK